MRTYMVLFLFIQILYGKSNSFTLENIMYQNQPFLKVYSWEQSKQYCQELKLDGYNNWRLPTREELSKLGNIKLYHFGTIRGANSWYFKHILERLESSKGSYYFIRREFVENMPKTKQYGSVRASFWTSEYKDKRYIWFVDFTGGDICWFGRSPKLYTLCVRK